MSLQHLQQTKGLVFQGVERPVLLGLDAQANLTTTANAGVPALFTQYVDPRVIETVLTPVRAAEIFSERRMGDMTTVNAQFLRVENTGNVASYGDFDDNGQADVNASFPVRDHYYYQTMIRVGEKEVEQYAKANIDWTFQKQNSAAMALNRFQNQTYIFGIEGLKLYGILNDPNLIAPLNINVASLESMVAEDMLNLVFRPIYKQLVSQSPGNINASLPMTLILSPAMETYMQNTNSFGNSVADLLKKNYPNLTIEVVPEYGQGSGGENIQWIVKEHNGVPTVELGFTEKMRVHAMEIKTSGYLQKRSQGTLGACVFQPIFVSSAVVGSN